MAVLMSGGQSDALAPASSVAITAFPFTIAYWVYNVSGTGYTSRVQLIWHDANDAAACYTEVHSQAYPTATTDGKCRHRVERNAYGAGVTYTPLLDDAFDEDTAAHICVVYAAAGDVKLYIDGSLANTTTASRNFFNGAGATLDDLFIGGKNPTTNENAFTGYLQDVAIWDGTALDTTSITQLQSYWSDTIPTAPDWSWRLSADINADTGGINLTDVGTSSYSIETDIVSLSEYGGATGTSARLGGSGGGVIGPNGGLIVT